MAHVVSSQAGRCNAKWQWLDRDKTAWACRVGGRVTVLYIISFHYHYIILVDLGP